MTAIFGGQLCPDFANSGTVASLASGSVFTFSVTNGSKVQMGSMDFARDYSTQPRKHVVCHENNGGAACSEGYLLFMAQCYKLFGQDGNVTYTEAEYFCDLEGGHVMAPSTPMQVCISRKNIWTVHDSSLKCLDTIPVSLPVR